jgi:hypothetical protein
MKAVIYVGLAVQIARIKPIFFATTLIVFPLSGCAGFNLYNAENDKLAQSVKASYEEANLLKVIPAHESNLEAILNHELDVARRYVRARAETDLALLLEVNQPLSKVWRDDQLGARLQKIGFKGADTDARINSATNFSQAQVSNDGKKAALNNVKMVFEATMLVTPPVCPLDGILPDLPETRAQWIARAVKAGADARVADASIDTLYARYQADCTSFRSSVPNDFTPTGLLPEGMAEVKRIKADIAKLKTNAKTKATEALKALCKLKTNDETLKNGKECAAKPPKEGKSGKPTEIFKDKIEDVQNALKAMGSAADAFGELEAIELQIAEINNVISMIIGKEGDKGKPAEASAFKDGGNRVAELTSAMLSLADSAQALSEATDVVPVSPLLMEKQRLEAQKAAASARVKRMEDRLALKELIVSSLIKETDQLLDAEKYARWATRDAIKVNGNIVDPLAGTFDDVLKGKSGNASKERMLQAIQTYASTVLTYRREQEEAEWREIALEYRAALEESQAGLTEWNSLITTPVNQIAAYHSGGIKPEQISGLLIQALGLGGIALGVNK